MDLEGKMVEEGNFSFMPPGINFKEKIYYLIAQTSAVTFPISLLYSASGDYQKTGITIAGISLALVYGGSFALMNSYNGRHGKDAMTIDWVPRFSSASKKAHRNP
ncbi:MAG: hypothetical protein AABX93_01535 [Nanoarchaeota archaeon]